MLFLFEDSKKAKTEWKGHNWPPAISDLAMEIKCSPLLTSIIIQSSSLLPLNWAIECNKMPAIKTQSAIIKIKKQPFDKVSRPVVFGFSSFYALSSSLSFMQMPS